MIQLSSRKLGYTARLASVNCRISVATFCLHLITIKIIITVRLRDHFRRGDYCIFKLKNWKSPGPDCISNEILRCTLQHNPRVFLNIFNHILKHGLDIPTWKISMIVPFHTKGDLNDPGNYRGEGVSLLSCFAKFFYSILNKRLLDYCAMNNILKPNQLRFTPGNRTSGVHIILHKLIEKYCQKSNKKTTIIRQFCRF